jgi:hypothetical protein
MEVRDRHRQQRVWWEEGGIKQQATDGTYAGVGDADLLAVEGDVAGLVLIIELVGEVVLEVLPAKRREED